MTTKTDTKPAQAGNKVKLDGKLAVTHAGKTYPSMAELAKSLDMKPTAIRSLVRGGLTLDDAVTKALANKAKREAAPKLKTKPKTKK